MIHLLLIFTLASAPPTQPPGATATDPIKRAQVAFSEGTGHYDAGEFGRALASFRVAFRLSPHGKVRFNVGRCLVELGRHREAFEEFEAATRSPSLSGAERERARAQADKAAAQLGTLSFVGQPGRDVEVDGQLRCTTPCSIALDPGVHYVVTEPGSGAVRHRVTTATTTRVVVRTPKTAPQQSATEGPSHPIPQTGVATVGPHRPPGRPSALTWAGAATGLAGLAGILGFGLRARALHAAYIGAPTPDGRQRGVRMRTFTNVSIGVASLGASLVIVDLIRMRRARRRVRPRHTAAW